VTGDRLSDVVGPFLIVPEALYDDERASDTDRRVYGALYASLRRGATSGTVHLGRIVERANRSRRTVERSLARLEAWGYVHRRHTAGRPVHYTLQRLTPAPDGNLQLPGFDVGGTSQLRRDPYVTAQRDRDVTPKTLVEKAEGAGAAQGPNGNPEPLEPVLFPTTGPFARLDPHAWDDVSTNGNGSRPA
jgi:hypothetical protein